jgi:prepilin-type N-terminal cleavage/methylation domain-containing protein
MRQARAFTLVEILIVVVLLGIMAGIVIPAIGRSTSGARETTLAMNINLLRRFIPVYTSHHQEIAPGYPDGDTTAAPTAEAFIDQAVLSSNSVGQTAPRGTVGYPYGPYLSQIPANPFNSKETVRVLADNEAFPSLADGNHGWMYKPATGEVRPDNIGTHEDGRAYYDD